MRGIYCSIITQKVRDLAKELKLSDAYVNNMVSVWKTANRTSVDPDAKDLKSYFWDDNL